MFRAFCAVLRRHIFRPFTPYQKPVTVHPEGRTGNEGHIVLALHDRQQGRVARQNHVDLIHRISQRLVQDMD